MSAPPTVLPSSSADLARYLHDHGAVAAPAIVAVDPTCAGPQAVHAVVLPEGPGHPADVLVGFLADERFCALGIIAGGRLRHLDGAHGATVGTERTAVTALAHRDGTFTSVLGAPGASPTVLHEPPLGWVADLLRRSLGLPTPEPAEPIGAWVDALWLEALAAPVLRHPGRRWTWARLAALHPFCPAGPPPPPAALGAQLRAFCTSHPWSWARQAREGGRPPAGPGLPRALGRYAPGADWFDDGSMARWSMRATMAAEDLLPDVLEVLSTALGDCITSALVATPAPR